jgi:signal transduction histidine kinase/CheY-like chemotaxis protein
MKNDKYFSSLNILLDNVEGTNLLLEYFAEYSKKIFKAVDFNTIIDICHKELRKIYVNQNIEFVLWHNHKRLIKFIFNDKSKRVSPVEEFSESRTLYNYVLEQQQLTLTNNYRQFCENLGVQEGGIDASSWLGVPMVVRGKVLGIIVIWDQNPERYLRLQDKQFMLAIANMTSFAVENIYLYDYIVEKNGSYKIFETVLPASLRKNSIKNVINQLLNAALKQNDAIYSGIFLRSQYHKKWRLLSEQYKLEALSRLGLDFIEGLYNLKDSEFENTDYLYWHEQFVTHQLNIVFKEIIKKYPLNSVILFPFSIEKSYYGIWLTSFNRDENQPSHEELQLFRFISYLLVQLIEKKALMERKNKYESYMKHLEKMKVVGELASGSAHHLNNILSVILGKSQMLYKKLKDNDLRRDLRIIEGAASDGVLAVKRLQSVRSQGEKQSKHIPLNLNELIQEVVEVARPRFEREAQSRGINYDLKLNLTEIYPVKGDSAELREVFLNLVNNALDAMPAGGQLSIQTTQKEKVVLVFVSDTGIGISDEIRDKIFEPFFSTKGEKGNGLGLSIAAEIIARHKGKIYVDSIPRKGSIFMVELPAIKDWDKTVTETRSISNGVHYKVLLVDDEGIVRETLAEMLENDGCEVTMASSAEDAILKFQKYQCEVVLTDLSMPGINGFELAKRIKKIDSNVPIFLITGWNQLDRKFIESNEVIDGIIEKPFGMDQIRKEISRVLNSNGHTQDLKHIKV